MPLKPLYGFRFKLCGDYDLHLTPPLLKKIMWFEGVEKKFELISKGAQFRSYDPAFWHQTVQLANAKILNKISNEQTDAYLLSESSLFVWDDRVTMITCGRTTLVKAAAHIIDHVGAQKVNLLTYERKNEYYPHQQETDFHKDVAILQERYPGKAFRFGMPDEHHLFLFHGEAAYKPTTVDCTLEILMYNLSAGCNRLDLSKLEGIFPGFQIDEHIFEPCGYSINAIRGSEYYTIHVTPEEHGSYASFETNVKLGNRIVTGLRSVLELFQPRSFDAIYFHPEKGLKAFELDPYVQRNYVRQSLSCGYEVGFATYYLKTLEPMLAVPLESRP
jgi:S-adenosylmethionine decarboxylase